MPTVAVYDIVIHPHDRDIILGTHGRGIYVLDDISALEEWKPALAEKPVHLFHLVNQRGGVSPLCARRPRALDSRRAGWTFDEKDVTCPRCRAAIGRRAANGRPSELDPGLR